MSLAASGTLVTDTKVYYLLNLVRGEALHQFNLLFADVEGKNYLTVEILF